MADGVIDAREVLELSVRQGLTGPEVAETLGIRTEHAYVVLSRMRPRASAAIGALMVARTGRRDCADLHTALRTWSSRYSPEIRRRIQRHIDDCSMCLERRGTLVAPLAAMASATTIPATMAGASELAPAPALRDRVLATYDGLQATTPSVTAAPDATDPGAKHGHRRRRALHGVASLAVVGLVLTIPTRLDPAETLPESRSVAPIARQTPQPAAPDAGGPSHQPAESTTGPRRLASTSGDPASLVSASKGSSGASSADSGDLADSADMMLTGVDNGVVTTTPVAAPPTDEPTAQGGDAPWIPLPGWIGPDGIPPAATVPSPATTSPTTTAPPRTDPPTTTSPTTAPPRTDPPITSPPTTTAPPRTDPPITTVPTRPPRSAGEAPDEDEAAVGQSGAREPEGIPAFARHVLEVRRRLEHRIERGAEVGATGEVLSDRGVAFG